MAHHDHAAHGHGDHGDDEYDVHAHVSPVKTYVAVLGALFFFTGLTVLAYNVGLGEWNLAVAIIIASAKASLVITYFMHMKHDTRLNAVVFLSALVFGGIFLVYTMNDTQTRAMGGDEYNGAQRDIDNVGYAAGTAPGLVQAGAEVAPLPPLPEPAAAAPAEAAPEGEGTE
jgi:cytochrome c oxidase subunit 4